MKALRIICLIASLGLLALFAQANAQETVNSRISRLEREVNQHVSRGGHDDSVKRLTTVQVTLSHLIERVSRIEGFGGGLSAVIVILQIAMLAMDRRQSRR